LAFAVLFALAALDSAGYSIIAPVVPEIGDATGAGPGLMGALVASFAVGQMAGYPLAARVLQRRHALAVLFVSLALVIVGDLGFIFGESLGVYFPSRGSARAACGSGRRSRSSSGFPVRNTSG
jgi:MFS family permease